MPDEYTAAEWTDIRLQAHATELGVTLMFRRDGKAQLYSTLGRPGAWQTPDELLSSIVSQAGVG